MESLSADQHFSSPEQLWKAIEGSEEKVWYGAAVSYWDEQEASYDGVLGGYGHVSGADIEESDKFLKKAIATQLSEAKSGSRQLVALGESRAASLSSIMKLKTPGVTEQLLLHHFHEVDLVEPSTHLLATAKTRLEDKQRQKGIPAGHSAVEYFCMGLQQYTPAADRYDVVWVQWALLYLTDDDAIAFFDRCRVGLKADGVIFVKENICHNAAGFIVDKEDSSLTRSHAYMLKLFDRASLQLLFSAQQRNFPKDLYKVHMYALRPRKR